MVDATSVDAKESVEQEGLKTEYRKAVNDAQELGRTIRRNVENKLMSGLSPEMVQKGIVEVPPLHLRDGLIKVTEASDRSWSARVVYPLTGKPVEVNLSAIVNFGPVTNSR